MSFSSSTLAGDHFSVLYGPLSPTASTGIFKQQEDGQSYSFFHLVHKVRVTHCADKVHVIPCGYGDFERQTRTPHAGGGSAWGVAHACMHCLVKLRLRCIHEGESRITIALSGCLNRSWRTPILVGVTCLHALQLSSHSRIKTIIRFFQVPCKHTDRPEWWIEV